MHTQREGPPSKWQPMISSMENVTEKIKFRDPIRCRQRGYRIMCKNKKKQIYENNWWSQWGEGWEDGRTR
uniref:Uncharacterized protein n=1 Tax=Suricata suricatta TaxID=37032 RepID=A0A673VN15_SURSU